MNELSLFTGAGGGIWGSKLLGWRTIGYVEINAYCQKVIQARIGEGYFDDAPIFGDIRAFIHRRCAGAHSYRGLVDVLSAGFPCQPFSSAGKRLGEADSRNLWPQTIRCIRIVRPRYVFLENSATLTSQRYFGTILGDLAEAGYDAEWCVLGAGDVGAPHERKRVWILAHANGRWELQPEGAVGHQRGWVGNGGEEISDTNRYKLRNESGRCCGESWEGASEPGDDGSEMDVADASIARREGRVQESYEGRPRSEQRGQEVSYAKRQRREEGEFSVRKKKEQPLPSGCCSWWDIDPADLPDTERDGCDEGTKILCGRKSILAAFSQDNGENGWPIESRVGRVVDGLADRRNRVTAVGEGQVSQVVATAWRLLSKGIE